MDRIVSRSRLKSPESSSLKSNYRIPNTAKEKHSSSRRSEAYIPASPRQNPAAFEKHDETWLLTMLL